jgi:hypothetical protein
MDSDLMDAADIYMGHPAGELELLLKSLHKRLVAREIDAKGLQRNLFPYKLIIGPIYLTHSSPADQRADAISIGNDLPISQATGANNGLIQGTTRLIVFNEETLDLGA